MMAAALSTYTRRPAADRHRRKAEQRRRRDAPRALALQYLPFAIQLRVPPRAAARVWPAACRSSRRCSRWTARPPPTCAGIHLPPAGDDRRRAAAGTGGRRHDTMSVDVWLRGTDFATTATIEGIPRAPRAWTDEDVRLVLEGMLRAMDRLKQPGEGDRDDRAARPELDRESLRRRRRRHRDRDHAGRGRSPGPFDIDKAALEAMIARVLTQPVAPPSSTVH